MFPADELASRAVEQLLREQFATITVTEELQGRIRQTFDAAARFFTSSSEEKLSNRLRLDTGYRPYGVEYSRSPDHPDDVESFTVSPRAQVTAADLHTEAGLAIYQAMLSVYGSMVSLLGIIATTLAAKFDRNFDCRGLAPAIFQWSILQLNYSRPAQTGAEFINDPHEDGCLLTMISVTTPGLEIQSDENTFIPFAPTPNQLLILPGEILWLLSGGKITPTFHRVRALPQYSERMSLNFFGDISPDLCEPWVRNEVNKDVDIGNLVLKNSSRYGLAEWTKDGTT